jgi:23S rRNA (adenine2503-C2)-methyltransferase
VEAVIIPGPARTTLCVSSQVGCARACTFCETGLLVLVRQLSAGEIIDQVRLAQQVFASRVAAGASRIGNLIFMGMGEPFDKLAEVTRAICLLTDSHAFALAPSRITVSTGGVADKLPAFFRDCHAELAMSLNAPDDVRRALEDAELLAAYVSGLRCRVNVIPCNPGPDPRLRPPSAERVDAFVARLSGSG